ncbi:MAG TPA: hypothetical protein VIF34_06555 [Methylocystis sp.]
MSAPIISTLRDKRLEVADAIERLERQVDQHRADLAHLEATMRLFDPNVEPETLQPIPPRRRNDWFRPDNAPSASKQTKGAVETRTSPPHVE